MKKHAVIVHGWASYPEEGWFPWLKKELEIKGFEVSVPQLPNADYPKIESWVMKLRETVVTPDEHTYFVGHSIGCQTILRYIETLPVDMKLGGAIFVAGFFRLTNLETEEERETAKPWLETPINFQKINSCLPKSVAIFSDDDPWVPLDNQNDFREKLHSEIIIEHAKGHFNGNRDKAFELPIVLEKILSL